MVAPDNPITRLERFVDEIDRRVTDLELADPEERRARAVLRRIQRAEQVTAPGVPLLTVSLIRCRPNGVT